MGTHGLYAVSRLLREFQRISPTITIQTAEAFVLVAIHEGLTIGQLGERIGVSTSGASHATSMLTRHGRRGKPGLDLVEMREDPQDRRIRGLYLTAKGKMHKQALLDEVSVVNKPEEA